MTKTLADIAETMRDIDFGMLSTRTDGGAIAARPMSNNRDVEYDGNSWYFACENTRTVQDIAADARVGISFQTKGGLLGKPPMFVHVEGRAELIKDKSAFAEHWTKGLDLWFEQGIDTPGLTLIHVTGERAHYWDGADQGELMLEGATPETKAIDTA